MHARPCLNKVVISDVPARRGTGGITGPGPPKVMKNARSGNDSFMKPLPSPLSSRPKRRDLQFYGPFLEMFFDKAQREWRDLRFPFRFSQPLKPLCTFSPYFLLHTTWSAEGAPQRFYSRPPHRKFASCRVSRTDRDVLSASKSHTSTVELQRPESLRKPGCRNKRKDAQNR
jgi:hypothetical protein